MKVCYRRDWEAGLGGMEGGGRSADSLLASLVGVACGFPRSACSSWGLGESNDWGTRLGGEELCDPKEGRLHSCAAELRVRLGVGSGGMEERQSSAVSLPASLAEGTSYEL